MTEHTLLAASFADAVKAIESARELPARTRSHWVCSLRQIAKTLDKPLEAIPARWTSARFPIGRLHYARVGPTPKTLANHKSNVRTALLWFANEKGLPRRGTPLTADWKRLRNQLAERHCRSVLSSLMRYCSARRIAPEAVNEQVLDAYMDYRAETTALACNDAARRAMARAWNGCAGNIEGWPQHCLLEPALKGIEGPAWEDFPEGLRADVERYLKGLTRFRKSVNGRRIRPCKASTLKTRRAELVAAARMTVREGIPVVSLVSLEALLDPTVVEKIIEAYWRADGTEPRTYTIDLGWKLHSIAREIGGF